MLYRIFLFKLVQRTRLRQDRWGGNSWQYLMDWTEQIWPVKKQR